MQYHPSYNFHYLVIWLLLCSCFVSVPCAHAQLGNLWDESYGGSGWEELNNSKLTSDGGFILSGYSSSDVSVDVSTGNFGVGDFWILKVNENGDKEWDARFGGSGLDRCLEVIETAEGGYLFAGNSASGVSGNKTTPNQGLDDYWVIKTDSQGNKEWEKNFGGSNFEFLTTVIQTPEGGYLLGGLSASGVSQDKSEPNRGGSDLWIIKIDAEGNKEWDKTLGGDNDERINCLLVDTDGNYLLGGSAMSTVGGDVTLPPIGTTDTGVKDFWFLKVSSVDGEIIWQHRYGGDGVEEITMFNRTQDGGFFLVGLSESNASIWKSENTRGDFDMWGLKIDAEGNKEWDITLGGSGMDACNSFLQNNGGYYLLGGFTGSGMDGDKTEPSFGGWDYWLVALNENGEKIWDQSIGGADNDVLVDIFQHRDGNYILAGHSSSLVTGNKTDPSNGLNDFWVVRTTCDLVTHLPDTSYCYGDGIVVNANDFNNCTDCDIQWSDGVEDFSHVFSQLTSGTYYTTLTSSVACERFDTMLVEVNTLPEVELGSDTQGLCRDSVLEIGRLLDNINSYEWSTNASSPTIMVDQPGNYAVTVTDNNGCSDTDLVSFNIVEPPQVYLGADRDICPNEIISLDAGNPGNVYKWMPLDLDEQVIEVMFDTTTLLSLSITSETGCAGSDTVLLTVKSIPTAEVQEVLCSEDNHSYQVQFMVNDEDLSGFQIYGNIGFADLYDDVYITDELLRVDTFGFSIFNNNNCPPYEFSGRVDDFCPCLSDAGTLVDTATVVLCENSEEEVIYLGQYLDFNDTVNYILHDGGIDQIGNIYSISNRPFISHASGVAYNTTYYFSAVVGNKLASDTLLVDRTEGCVSIGAGKPVRFLGKPLADIFIQAPNAEITCNDATLVLSGENSQSPFNLEYLWETEEGSFLSGTTTTIAEINGGGEYSLIVGDEIGCFDTASIYIIDNTILPEITMTTSGAITCNDAMVAIDAHTSSNGPSYENSWYGNGIDGVTGLIQLVDRPGVYHLSITNTETGCVNEDSIEVYLDQGPAEVYLDTVYQLDCQTNEVSIEPIYANDDYVLNWTSWTGNVVANDGLTILVNQIGEYVLEVYDPNNGCLDTLYTRAVDNIYGNFLPHLTVEQPVCEDDPYGNIVIDSITGGRQPYSFELNNEDVALSQFSNLMAGEYFYAVKDASGCVYEDTVIIRTPEPFFVEIIGNDLVNLGDSVFLEALFSSEPDTFYWNSSPFLSCVDCIDPVAAPLYTDRLIVNGVNDKGCVVADSILLTVNKDRSVFIPTAFSPNNDGRNDHFVIYGDQSVDIITDMIVFNRWGAVMYEGRNLAPNDLSSGWDGVLDGTLLPDGVYVYVVKILFKDGYEETYTGDVTILR